MQPVAGSTITLTVTVTNNGIPTNASAILFKWKIGVWGAEQTVAPVNFATGVYKATITPLEGGNLYYRWDTEGALDTAKEGIIAVRESRFAL